MTLDILLFGALTLMIIFLIMQNRRRRKEMEVMQSSLSIGSAVTMHAGIVGKVVAINGDEVEIESGKSRFVILRGAIGKVQPAGEK